MNTEPLNGNPLYPGLNLGQKHGSSHPAAENIMFGFWVFLMIDALTFALFFAVYATTLNPTAFAGGPMPRDVFDLPGVALETGALLLSSLACGACSLIIKHVHHEEAGEPKHTSLLIALGVTLSLGLVFLGHECFSFAQMAEVGAVPQRSGWLSAFYALVGLHGFHIFSGLVWGLVLAVQLKTIGLTHDVKTRFMRWALFWHFLDIIWLFIFSFVFLTGVIS